MKPELPVKRSDISSEYQSSEDDIGKNKNNLSENDAAEDKDKDNLDDNLGDSNTNQENNSEDADEDDQDFNETVILRFPFLKDHGQDPMASLDYLKLTLGASMSRQRDDSHLRTLQKLYPEWYDPESSKKLRQSKDLKFSVAIPVSERLSAGSARISHKSATTPSPRLSPRPPYNKLPSSDGSRSLTRHSSIVEEVSLPSPESGAGNLVLQTPSSDSLSWVDRNRMKDVWSRKNHAKCQSEFDHRSTTVPNLRLSPVFTFPPSPKRRHGVLSTSPVSPRFLAPQEILSASTSPPTSPATARSITADTQPTKPRLFRSKTVGPVGPSRSPGAQCPRRKEHAGHGSSSTSPRSPQVLTSRDRRSSTSSQGRRNSAVERLLGDITQVPSLVGVDGLMQRRRRVSRRSSDTSSFIRCEVTMATSITGLEKFRSLVRTVRIIAGVCLALKSYAVKKVTTHWSFVEMYLHLQRDITPSLAFNPHNFSKIQPPKGGRRLERLLSIPPEYRSPQDIQNILAFVRTHRTFQHFPAHLQVKLCMVMQYQSYEPRRIILKEGHPPSAFYLVLSGTLMVNIRDTNPATGQIFIRTVSDVTEGDCFGEIALLERIQRTATITCKTKSELLVIYKEDFERLILYPLLEQRDNDIRFCLNHALFEEFSHQIFLSHPQDVFYQYFPRDTVIAPDSLTCPFIILVKSGVCQVVASYKKLASTPESDTPGLVEITPSDLEQAFPLYSQMRKIGSSNRGDTSCEEASTISKALEEGLLMGSIDKHTLRKASARPNTCKPETSAISHSPRNRSSTFSTVFSQLEDGRRQFQKELGKDSDTSGGQYWSLRLSGPDRAKTDSRSVKTLNRKKGKLWKILQEDTQVFAELATLKEGCVFGLETMVGRPGPSVTLVSLGAECIMVSKKLFLQFANIKSLRVAGDLVMTFPSPDTLRHKVRQNSQWEHYKHDLVKTIVRCGVPT